MRYKTRGPQSQTRTMNEQLNVVLQLKAGLNSWASLSLSWDAGIGGGGARRRGEGAAHRTRSVQANNKKEKEKERGATPIRDTDDLRCDATLNR